MTICSCRGKGPPCFRAKRGRLRIASSRVRLAGVVALLKRRRQKKCPAGEIHLSPAGHKQKRLVPGRLCRLTTFRDFDDVRRTITQNGLAGRVRSVLRVALPLNSRELFLLGGPFERGGRGQPAGDGLRDRVEVAGADEALM